MTYTDEYINVQTDKIDPDEFEEWTGIGNGACNKFSFAYQAENPHAVVKVAEVQGKIHAFVYDSKLDVTIDATLRQFDGLTDSCWDGDEHPHVDSRWMDEFDNHDDFLAEYDGAYSPFYI